MKKIYLTMALGAATALMFAPLAQAGDEKKSGKDKKEWFEKADTEKDGFLTLEEFSAAKGDKLEEAEIAEKFAKMDADSDGKLSLAECKKHKKDPEAAEE